jgi:hypothetical protein
MSTRFVVRELFVAGITVDGETLFRTLRNFLQNRSRNRYYVLKAFGCSAD